MAFITDILNTIKNAHKGKDMRQAIYDGIQQCYEDATGHPDSVAAAVKKIGEVSANLSKETADRKAEVNTERKRIDNLIKELPATAGEYQQSKLVLHSYDNAAVKCTTTSGNYTNVPAFATDQGGPLSSLYTKKSNYQIAVNKSGLYLFELRIHVNSLIANKRVELAPFVNDTRIAALASSYNTAGNFTLTQVAALPLWLSANDTVDFRIAPIEAAEVSLQLGDVLVYAIDWEDKFKIPDYTGYAAETKDIRTGADGTVYGTAGEAVRKQIGNITEDLDYKQNMGLVPAQFETILGYYKGTEFVEGQRAWVARIARVSVQSGEKYRYMYSTDLPTVVTFLDDEKKVISQITVDRNTTGVMDVYIPNRATYADFYNAFNSRKFECLRYSNSSKLESMIFSDDIESFEVISNRYFSPSQDDLLIGNKQQLYSYTATESSIFRISFIQHQPFTVYVDDFCCVDRNDYVNGTEVYRENCIVYVPKGKTLRINSYISSNEEEKTKIEKYIEISEKYINEKIPEIKEVVDVVSKDLENPVSSKGVYNAIQTNGVNVSTGLPFVAVASSEAPKAIKSVCQFVCDGTDDNVEIQNAIDSLASTGGKIFLTKGKFFISAPVDTGNTLIELCGEGALLDLREDTVSSSTRGGTILQAVGNTDLVHIGGAKGTTVHDIAFFGYGRNKVDNTSYGIKFTGHADTDRIYNCGFTNCAIAIGSDIATDVVYIHNLSVQRNKIGIALYRTDAEIHDCIFCENIGMESVIWDNETYNINCADICAKDGGSKIYNNTFRRSGMCYDIYNVYGNESKLESDVVNPISSVVLLGVAKILSNYFYDQIYANCIRVMSKPDFIYIEGNSFTKWGRAELEDESKKAAICFEKGSVLGTIMNNRFYSDSNTQKFTDKYAIYEVSIGNDNNYWSYSNTYANNFIGNLTGETDNKCVIVGTSVNNKFINNIIAEKYKDTAIVN